MASPAYPYYLRVLKSRWFLYVLGVVMILVTSISEVAVPKFVQWALDLIIGGSALPNWIDADSQAASLDRITVGLLIAVIVGWLSRIGWRQTLARTTHLAARDMRRQFWGRLSLQPVHVFHRYPIGELMSRATGDINVGRFVFGFTLVLILDTVFFTLLALVMMLTIDWVLTLACLAIVPFIPKPITRLGIKEFDLHLIAQDRLAKLSDAIAQSLGSVRMQRATASEANWQRRLDQEANLYARRRFKEILTGWKVYPLGALPSVVAYMVLLTFGIYRLQQGFLSIGEFVAFQSYVFLIQAPLFQVGEAIAEWQRGIASVERIQEILGLDSPQFDRPKPQQVDRAPSVEIRNLSFGFAGQGHRLFEGLDLSVASGRRIGITGGIGSGKSTLLDLIAGLEESQSGQVFLFGNDVAAVHRQYFAQSISYVPQKPFLFSGSVRENLNLDLQCGDPELWRVLEAVCLADDVRGFGGLDSQIGEWGINLSGGQKQRLTLARALLRPKPLLFLDDCLSAVDTVNEQLIVKNIDQYLSKVTTIWTAHRYSTLRLCDEVYELTERRLRKVGV